MVRKFFWVLVLMALQQYVIAQSGPFSKDFKELPDPKPVNTASWQAVSGNQVHFSFADVSVRYEKRNAPDAATLPKQWTAKAWKGEKVHTQLLIWTAQPLQEVSMEVLPLQDDKGNKIKTSQISTGFLRYVMTDGLNKEGGGCGHRAPGEYDSSLVADAIDIINKRDIPANTTQPVWLSVDVPANTPAGIYNGYVKVKIGRNSTPAMLPYQVQVLEHTLPAPKDWKYHLDLWQSPYAISRMYGVKDWSKAHFAAMKPYMQELAKVGQKVITATIIHDPWNSQTEDIYGTMVKWTKKRDGSWAYDYTVFDKWVQFMMDLGIRNEISCYSMIPWNLKFYYYDEAAGKDTFIIAKPGTAEYTAHWKPMLTDFAKHLKAKGWFGITAIAMDERPMKDMQQALAIIKAVDKNFKVSMAGNYHPEIEADIHDYCIAAGLDFDKDVRAYRKQHNMPSTFYTCCTEGFPNTFTFSPPAEATWLGWHAAAKGYDGYLRWAYNCWVKDPLQDSRFRTWAAGDTYLVYPGWRSSIRFERLREGIQDFEKIRILREKFTQAHNTAKLEALDKMLTGFEISALKSTSAADMLKTAKAQLNEF
ncbi:DUF4091 domain-containing protein [Chitinophaga defluvii]|uniref:Glycoside hydrolase domain-containing protein n=1 Tax=Chitinophaga defluvii TaxID=3163343 RepID=A0ABV2TGF8_9BACT